VREDRTKGRSQGQGDQRALAADPRARLAERGREQRRRTCFATFTPRRFQRHSRSVQKVQRRDRLDSGLRAAQRNERRRYSRPACAALGICRSSRAALGIRRSSEPRSAFAVYPELRSVFAVYPEPRSALSACYRFSAERCFAVTDSRSLTQ
jgi:hypothetical protein